MKYRKLVYLALALVAVPAFFSYGVLVGKYEFYPYRVLASMKQSFAPILEDALVADIDMPIDTNLLQLSKNTYNFLNQAGLAGYGGGFAKANSKVVGVDKEGHFFIYERGGVITPLNLGLPTNEGLFLKHLHENVKDTFQVTRIHRYFRVMGLAAKEYGDDVHLYVSYNFWHDDEKAKSTRVARIIIPAFNDFIIQNEPTATAQWEVLYETTPHMSFTDNIAISGDVPFRSNRSGGRLVIDGSGDLIFGIGDQAFDGVANPDASQDDNSSYGKMIKVDLSTLEVTTLAKGVRNPQGLFLDRNNNLWETEHGPKGGDELNLIVAGTNYGWPYVTYGTQYNEYEWSLNERQGRHEGYQKPVFSWVPSIATSNGIEINSVPEQWDGDLLVSALATKSLYRIRVDQGRVMLVEPIYVGDRIRDLIQMADGTILFMTDTPRFVELAVMDNSEPKVDLLAELIADEDKREEVRSIINSCNECHSLKEGGTSTSAPSLWGVYGRGVASADYSGYSNALLNKGGVWDSASLSMFLEDSDAFVPDTNMPNQLITDKELQDYIIGYLEMLQ